MLSSLPLLSRESSVSDETVPVKANFRIKNCFKILATIMLETKTLLCFMQIRAIGNNQYFL